MTQQAINIGDSLPIIIIFQPELRRALEQLGRGTFFSRSNSPDDEEPEKMVEAIIRQQIIWQNGVLVP